MDGGYVKVPVPLWVSKYLEMRLSVRSLIRVYDYLQYGPFRNLSFHIWLIRLLFRPSLFEASLCDFSSIFSPTHSIDQTLPLSLDNSEIISLNSHWFHSFRIFKWSSHRSISHRGLYGTFSVTYMVTSHISCVFLELIFTNLVEEAWTLWSLRVRFN